jgi:hypothetical protein
MSTPADLLGSARRPRAPFSPLARALAALGLALLLPGCDNPACVFGGDCSDQGGVAGPQGPPAEIPLDGQWISNGAPRVTAAFPSGAGASTTSPVVLVFGESIAAGSLAGGFVIVQDLTLPGGPATSPPVPLNGVLVAEGRVAILSPPSLVAGATYRVRTAEQKRVRDLTGQLLVEPATGDLVTFTVAETNPVAPRLLTSWPPAGSTNAGQLTSIVAVFDRPMNPLTVNPTSFRVLVDGGPAAFDPPAQVLTVPSPFGGDVPESRVFTWRSVDPAGTPRSLGRNLPVELRLSPVGGSAIESSTGQALAPVVATFGTAPIELPLGAELLASGPEIPDDAIGRAQLDGSAPLMMLVRLALPAEAGDVLRVDLFGTGFGVPPRIHARSRTVELSAGQREVLLEAADLDLVASSAPLSARFADGPVAFAFQHQRGAISSQVRLLDTDPSQAGVQHPLLDIDPPSLSGLGFQGLTLDLRSSLPGLVVTGRADEPVRAVRVEALLLGGTQTNGALPRAVGADASGRFIAAPIPLGLLDPSEGAIPILVTVFDRALNPSPVLAGSYTQIGAVGPGLAPAGDEVSVRVYSSVSLAPLAGARVFVHEDDAGVLGPIDLAVTDASGRASVATGSVGTTILTVEAPGHDLFTFQGVTTARLDVPLTPTAPGTAAVVLAVTSPLADLPQLTLLAADSRRPAELGPTVASQSCFFNPFTQTAECAFLPIPVAAHSPGGLSLFAVESSAGNGPAFAQVFLKAFDLVMPLAPLEAGGSQVLSLEIPRLLDSIGADPEQAAIDVPPHALLAGVNVPGLNAAALSGTPRVSVQALPVGIPGAVAVGLGRTFPVTPTSWAVRAAYGGVADGTQDGPDDQLGELVRLGSLDGDLFLQAELVDLLGNRAGARARFSTTTLVLDPPGVPTVQGAQVEGGSRSLAFTVTVTDGLFDADLQPGLHRVRVTNATGRGWELWTVDRPDAAGGSFLALFPDIAALGGTGLGGSGTFAASASTVAWPGLDTGSALGGFLWADMAREHELYSSSAPLLFSAP